ncbi:MAG: nickel pincer cofactor biosynthesis protein LarC [Spirochaetaceae bacterium]|nr:nickel pincer cofactor biosynthesis protein LarC [Spirochaetaceae bacterium]
MKTLHVDCFAGISGDMTLGALVDLGVDPLALRQELEKLDLEGWSLRFYRDERGGISGTNAVVDISPEPQETHEGHHHHGKHRSWKDIRHLIGHSAIREGAKKRALAIFQRIASAEAQVHGQVVDEVTFHEVGAVDSIIDIVGAAIGLDMLKPDRITCTEIELGGGTVVCAHGTLPVPAPATLILVQGLPVKTGGFPAEMTTPTGAAILAASVDEFVQEARFTELKTGYGIGNRQLDKPNVLRLSLREEAPKRPAPWKTEELVLLETNIDDMSAEALGFLMERLFESGALDVSYSPCMMKKSRPGTRVSVLAAPARLDTLRRTLFRDSSTIGFRETSVRRLSLDREEGRVPGPWGEVRQKTVFFEGKPLRSKIEYEDRCRIAREQGISLEAVEGLCQSGKFQR